MLSKMQENPRSRIASACSLDIQSTPGGLTTSMLRSARGVFAISNPKGAPLPNGWDEGMVQLVRDQLLQVFSHPVENSKGGWEMLRDIMRNNQQGMQAQQARRK